MQRYEGKNGRHQDCYICGSYKRRTKKDCSAHFIRTDMLSELVTDNLKMVTRYAKDHEERFLTQLQTQCQTNSAKERNTLQRQMEKDKARVKELDLFIKRLYEDNVTGKISDERYATMMKDYEAEQRELNEKIDGMERDIQAAQDTDRSIDRFTEIVKKNLDFSELTPAILREFVDKIVVYEPVKIDENAPFFSLKLVYDRDGVLKETVPDGKRI